MRHFGLATLVPQGLPGSREQRPALPPLQLPQPSRAPFQARVVGLCFYVAVLAVLVLYLPRHVPHGANQAVGLLAFLGALGVWRYGWAGVHLLRAAWFLRVRFPGLRRAADQVGQTWKPPHVYFLVTSYRMEAELNVLVYRAIFQEVIGYGTPATIVAAVTDAADQQLLEQLFASERPPAHVELVLQKQAGTGKRDAMVAALRAMARRMPPRDSVVVFMDGDSVVPPGTLSRCLPFFPLLPAMGALTTDNDGVVTDHVWVKEWYDLRYSQRHLLMSSIAASGRLLVLTGRFSIFRAELATDPSFMDTLENDNLEHWHHGRFKFLTGDDKSTWYWLLKGGWDMLYVPDVSILCMEKLPYPSFVDSSVALMVRWFGNMMRNNGRAIGLGPRVTGPFIWWCLVDQRLSPWTALSGPAFGLLSALFIHPKVLAYYLTWVMGTRLVQTLILGVVRGRISPFHPLLMFYNQVSGSLVKVYMTFRLDKQKWTRQGLVTVAQPLRFSQRLRQSWTQYLTLVSGAAFAFAMAVHADVLRVPDLLSWAQARAAVLPAAAQPDLQALLDRTPPGGVVQLPEGTFTLARELRMERNGVTLAGAGLGKTVLRASFPGVDQAVVRVAGGPVALTQGTPRWGLREPVGEDATALVLDSPPSVQAGDVLCLRAPNTAAYLATLGVADAPPDLPPLRQTLVEVARVEGPTVVLAQPTGLALPAGATVFPVAVVRDVTLRDLSIHYDLGAEPDAEHYAADRPLHAVDGVELSAALRPELRRVEIRHAGRRPLVLDQVLSPRLVDVQVHGAWNKGDDREGVLDLRRTYRGVLQGLQVRGLRHLLLADGSHHNRFTALDSDTSIEFAGGLSRHNVVQLAHGHLRPGHPFPAVSRLPPRAPGVVPDGPDNRVLDALDHEVFP